MELIAIIKMYYFAIIYISFAHNSGEAGRAKASEASHFILTSPAILTRIRYTLVNINTAIDSRISWLTNTIVTVDLIFTY